MTETLWTVGMVAAHLGVSVDNVRTLALREGFPAPIIIPSRGTGARDLMRWLPRDFADWTIDQVKPMSTGCQLYRHFDAAGRLLYVGISLSAINRLRHHRSRSPWVRQVATITVQQFESIAEARAAETAAIINEKPLHNSNHSKHTK